MVPNGEGVIADSCYLDPKCRTPTSAGDQIKIHSLARARHET